MQVILIKDVDNLGQAHELATVKSGYARNFLIPQKFAIEANPTNLKVLNEKLKVKAKKEAALLAQINEVVEVLKGSPVKIGAKTGTTDKIFGRVTSLQIARAIKEQKGYELDRKRIAIPEEVKEIGLHKATIDFGNGNITEIEFDVVAE
ncbi:50S ribosomal protein L9 [Rhizosphaericola mali]|uniref:Large ribosomal subunit protein bL9 n=1 Tax=Rhizosphaericola mali TaxID=2545455 RepID=A0A5P2FV82_9BACT|nr:50S ribosomal protein L9 [Rhizosphaericola mali]QES87396.1 50S ribosomal protein L9 [Rhizosphaericola mali]